MKEIWIRFINEAECRAHIEDISKIVDSHPGEYPVILYADDIKAYRKIKKMAGEEVICELQRVYGENNVKFHERAAVDEQPETEEAVCEMAILANDVDEVMEFGFSSLEAIEILKLRELKEINKALRSKLYVAGDVTAYQP